MPELPASVRVAVWTTHAWARGGPVEEALSRSLPDVDVVLGLLERLDLWRELGEQAVYAALPRPGATGLLPRCTPEALDAATLAGEAVFVAGVGGLSVPHHVSFGTDHVGSALRWEGHDAAPVPIHRLAGVDAAAADVELRTGVHHAIESLGDGGWADAWQRERPSRVVREWGLPADLPDRARGLIVRAGSILEIVDAGLEHAAGSAYSEVADRRRSVLLRLGDRATAAMEAGACVAASYLAAQSRTTRS